MAEIILPPEENEEIPQVPELNIDKPTENSKVITIEFEAKKTNKVSTKDTNQQLYTTDTDAWFEFKETSLEGANGTYSVVFRNRHDGSIFQRTGDVVNGVAYYKIPHQEIRHAGAWRGQIVYTLSNGDTTSREFGYDVKGHILDGKDVREIVVEDFETLMSQLRSMKDNAEVELASLTQELRNTTDTAEQNETDRQLFFDDLVEDIDGLQSNYQELLDTGVLQTNINTKLEALEEEYAPKLTEVTAQLAQIETVKADISYVNSKTQGVSLAYKESYESLSDLQNAYPNGDDYNHVVLADNMIYTWANNNWTNTEIQANGTGIANHSITTKKTDFAESVIVSENIYDTSTVVTGHGINSNTGELFSTTNLTTSDFIKVEPNTEYVGFNIGRVAKYDVNKQFISHIENGTRVFTTEENASYIRTSANNENVPTAMLVKGNRKPLSYIPYREETKIINFNYDEESIKSFLFPENRLSDEIEVEESNISFLERVSPNLFDNRKTELGFIHADTGGIVDYNDYHTTDFIVATPSTLYSANSIFRVAQYDADKQYISSFPERATSFTTDVNTAYLRASELPKNFDTAILAEGSIAGYVPYHRYKFDSSIDIEPTKKFEGGTWNVLGDSITAPNYAYWSVLATQLGVTKVNNYGIGGTAITPRAEPWDENAMSIRYADMDDDADLITVMGGTNDNPGVLGMPGLGTMADRDTSTFYGACHVLYGGLVEKYPTKRIAVFTPAPKRSLSDLKERVEIIKEVCAYYYIPCLDLFNNSQLKPYNDTNVASYFTDSGLHPNAEGHKLLANQMLQFLESL